MITVIICIILYFLGGIVSYISSILYEYYSNRKNRNKYNKKEQLQLAKEETDRETVLFPFTLSWVYFAILSLFLLYLLIQHYSYKLLEFLMTIRDK